MQMNEIHQRILTRTFEILLPETIVSPKFEPNTSELTKDLDDEIEALKIKCEIAEVN